MSTGSFSRTNKYILVLYWIYAPVCSVFADSSEWTVTFLLDSFILMISKISTVSIFIFNSEESSWSIYVTDVIQNASGIRWSLHDGKLDDEKNSSHVHFQYLRFMLCLGYSTKTTQLRDAPPDFFVIFKSFDGRINHSGRTQTAKGNCTLLGVV